jgi:hypothetical protein
MAFIPLDLRRQLALWVPSFLLSSANPTLVPFRCRPTQSLLTDCRRIRVKLLVTVPFLLDLRSVSYSVQCNAEINTLAKRHKLIQTLLRLFVVFFHSFSYSHIVQCQIKCRTGYTRSGSATTCLNGQLTSTQTCNAPGCTVAAPAQGSLGTCGTGASASITSGTTCSFACATGYQLNTSATTCNFGVASVQSCVEKGCTFSVAAPATIGSCTTSMKSGDVCSIQCPPGYTIVGAAATTCSKGVLNSGLSPQSCQGLPCNIAIPDGGKQGTTLPCPPSQLASGASCAYACDAAHQLHGTITTCMAGTLTASQNCGGRPCTIQAQLYGGLGTCPEFDTLPSGGSCQLNCMNGFELAASPSSTTCLDGTVTYQSCVPASCVVIKPDFGGIGNCGTTIAHGRTCTQMCTSGYTLTGAAATCSYGTFSPQTCVPSSCPVTAPSGGNLGTCTSSITHGTSCSYACNTGYTLFGDTSLNCLYGAINNTQTCKPNSCPVVAPEGGDLGTHTEREEETIESGQEATATAIDVRLPRALTSLCP